MRRLASPLSTKIKGVGVKVGVGVAVGNGVAVGTAVIGLPPGPLMGELGCSPPSLLIPVSVADGVAVGGVSMIVFGSMPGGMMITPGVPSWGGVTMIIVCTVPGVGVKVGARARVGTGVGVGLANKSAIEQPRVKSNRAPIARNSENRRGAVVRSGLLGLAEYKSVDGGFSTRTCSCALTATKPSILPIPTNSG